MVKSVLFSWLSKPQPKGKGGGMLRICMDIAHINVDDSKQYEGAIRSRVGSRALCHSGLAAHQRQLKVENWQIMNVLCEVHGRGL